MEHKKAVQIRLSIGKKIAQVRSSKGISQTFVAKRMGKTPQWLSNIENGRRPIEAAELYQLAAILGVDIVIFYTDELNVLFNCNADIPRVAGE
jgi:transcriptional regulator with XRE-family HTH domain